MKLYDRVKESILDVTYVREEVVPNSATEQYYNDLRKAIGLEDFPLILVNTIEKKTYITECNNQYFLVFDCYLLEIMDCLNQITISDNLSDNLNLFFYKTASEVCYAQGQITAAVKFASKYMNQIEGVLERYGEFSDIQSDYLFVQQAFLMAHEIFHFYVHKNPDKEVQGMVAKEQFLQRIYCYANVKEPHTAYMMSDVIGQKKMVEECLCDSTAVIQAIDAGVKVGKLNAVEAALAITMTVMNQYTVSILEDTIKHHGDISYERIQNMFNFRLLHLKAFLSLYIKEIGSEDEQKKFQVQVENVHNLWLNKVCRPIMNMLVEYNPLFHKKESLDAEENKVSKEARKILKQIYSFGI